MKKILNVAYYSQILDVEEDFWKKSGCGIVSIKMVIDYFLKNNEIKPPQLNKLFEEGIFVKGFVDGNWVHRSLNSLLRNYGINSYSQEFRSRLVDLEEGSVSVNKHEEKLSKDALDKFCEQIENNNPVIVSIYRDIKEKRGGHIIVLTGYEEDKDGLIGFFYNEPNSESKEQGKNVFVSKRKFLKMWKKYAIFVYK